MPAKKDATALAEKMIQVLEAQRRLGKDSDPLTLKRLAELTDPTAKERAILSAVKQRKAFGQHALVARQDLRAPVALKEDLPQLAASPVLLEFLLATARTPNNHAVSISKLKDKATSQLQKPFQDAINRQMQEESLPSTVGWILVKGSRSLFLLSDVHAGRAGSRLAQSLTPLPPTATTSATSMAAPSTPARTAGDFAPAFDTAFDRLNKQAGAHNFVSLVDLRRALAMSREMFDAGLRQLRVAGRYSLSAAEGRHGISAEEHEAGILEDGTLLLYVSRKSP